MDSKHITTESLQGMALGELVMLYRELGIDAQIDYDKFYLYSIITHSTAIEGSTVTELENQLLFDEGITAKGRSLEEQMMNLDLKAAYEWGMAQMKQHPRITTDFLRTLSAKVMARTGGEYNTLNGTFSAAKGDLRLVNVTAGFGGKSYMHFQKVPARLERFCEELNQRRASVDAADVVAVYALSFWAHYELVTIHPWADGNGRATRLLMNLLQMEYGVLPMKVAREEKGEYIQALIDTRESEDLSIFVRMMTELQERHLRQEIGAYVESMQGEMSGKDVKGGQKTPKVDRKGGQKTREAIVSLIASNASISSTQMAAALGINRSAVSKHLKTLQQANIILRVGPAKGGYWKIVNDKEE